MASDLASITSTEYQKLGIREKILALKNKAPRVTSERTDPAFEDSFGDQLSDLGGRRRWVLVGLALQKWHKDLRDRVEEVLRANQGEIYKGWSIRGTATQHCWMLGQDKTCAQPTVVISCNQSTVLKRTYRVVSQHGVLRAAKFALKAVPFCDLRLRMNPRYSSLSGEDHTLDENGEIRQHDHGNPIRARELDSGEQDEHGTQEQARTGEKEQDGEKERCEKKAEDKQGLENNSKDMTLLEETMPVRHPMDASGEDHIPLRFGAEEIFVPESGRPTTMGGFVIVDDVCFGLTTAHAFTEEEEGLGPRSINGSTTEPPLYDSDWANEDSGDDTEADNGLDPRRESQQQRPLQRKLKNRVVEDQTYYTTAWNSLHITATSGLSSAKGLDWALCELGDWGKYAINGVLLPPELRSPGAPEHLLFRNIKTTPPLGKILVATRRGAVPGIGTGSDCSIKLPQDTRYRHVWSVELEESLSSGDSGSWVIDAATGDVYGMIVAGSTELREEYIIPAMEVGQDICRVMRADAVRLPSFQDVMTAHTEELSTRSNLALNEDSMEWESDDSDEAHTQEDLDKDEERFLLAETLKHSSIETETLVKVIKMAGVRPKWTKISLPKGRSMRMAQRAIDRLLSSRRIRETATVSDKDCAKPDGQEEYRYIGAGSGEPEVPREIAEILDDDSTLVIEEPPELLESNPKFRAGISRRAWRAKRQAERGPKPHHRKSYRKSGDIPRLDPILKAPGSVEAQPSAHPSKFEVDSEDEHGNDDPDIIVVKHKGSTYKLEFPAFSIAEGLSLVGHLRQQAARAFGVEDVSRVTLLYHGRTLKTDARTCHEEGLRMRSEVLCVVKRTPLEEIEFLSHKFQTELVPQGRGFISDTPTDAEKRDLEYRKISETILMQILLKSDAVETEGDAEAKMRRKELVNEVQGFLSELDKAARRDLPSAWHADFIEQKQTPGARRTSTALPGRPPLTPSRSSKSGRSDGRNNTSPELNAEGR